MSILQHGGLTAGFPPKRLPRAIVVRILDLQYEVPLYSLTVAVVDDEPRHFAITAVFFLGHLKSTPGAIAFGATSFS